MEISAVSGVRYVVRIHCCNADDMVLVHVGLNLKKNELCFKRFLLLAQK